MNNRKTILLLLGALLLLTIHNTYAQAQHGTEDCDFNDAENVLRSGKQAIQDSIDLINLKPQAVVQTLSCAIPEQQAQQVLFREKDNQINGFFNQVANANVFLVVINEEGNYSPAPMNNVRYRNGDYLGTGIVVSAGRATAFAITGLKPSTGYYISIYAGNDHCPEGIKYNPVPLYSGLRRTIDGPLLQHYYGNLHSHSSYSDGNKENTSLTPADDYAYAKNAQCMDFLGIAEHNHYSSPGNPGMRLANYHLGIQQANAFTGSNPDFLALYGMEFGVINNGGHVVVYGIDSLLGWETLIGAPNYDIYVGKYDYSGTNGLFNTINRFRNSKAFGYMAHPEDTDYGNLLQVNYQQAADSAIIGSALENGPAFTDEVNYHDYPSVMSYLQYYKRLLAKGYHVGPLIDHDNHYLTFGRTARSRLVVLSPSLAKDDFMNAMRSLSFYATHSCTAELDFEVSGAGMGSQMAHPGLPAVVVTINDPSSNQQPLIRIYKGTNDGNMAALVATGSGNTFSFTDNSLGDGAAAYYFTDISIGNSRTISSPVWYTRNDQVTAITEAAARRPEQRLLIQDNPVRNSLLCYRISGDDNKSGGTARITDSYGRILLQQDIARGVGLHYLPVNNIPPGLYLLSVFVHGVAYREKFIKY